MHSTKLINQKYGHWQIKMLIREEETFIVQMLFRNIP